MKMYKNIQKKITEIMANSKEVKIIKKLTCTKCKGSSFNDRDELRKNCKTNWH